jgi:hypothetical protein
VKGAGVVLVVLGLCAPVALAAGGEPQRKYTTAGQARARQVGLRILDLPAGWTQTRRQSSDTTRPRCSYYNPDQSDLVQIGKYESPVFDTPNARISVSSAVFRSVAMGKSAYSRVAQPAFPKCMAELFSKGTAPGRATILSAGRFRFPSYGDRSDAFRIRASVKTPTAPARVYLDLFLVNRGAVDVAVLALGIGRPLPLSLEQLLVGKLAARAA